MQMAKELNAQVEPARVLLKLFVGHQFDMVGKCLLDTEVNTSEGSTPLKPVIGHLSSKIEVLTSKQSG